MATVDKPRRCGGGVRIDLETENQIVRMVREKHTNMAIARALNVSEGTVRRTRLRRGLKPVRPGRPSVQRKPRGVRVPNGPVREAIQQSDMPMASLCKELGFMQVRYGHRLDVDSAKLRRTFGMVATAERKRETGKRASYFQVTIPLELAEKACEVLGVDFDVLYPEVTELEPEMVCKGCGEQMRKAVKGKLCGWCIEELDPLPSALALELDAAKEWAA